MCIDNCQLNTVTICNRYPLPRIDDFFGQLQGVAMFFKINLRSGYYQLKIKMDDFLKTSFQTRYGPKKILAISFGLKNAPISFMILMNRGFKSILQSFFIVFIDDILFNSKSEDHESHLCTVLKLLKNKNLYAKYCKCKF